MDFDLKKSYAIGVRRKPGIFWPASRFLCWFDSIPFSHVAVLHNGVIYEAEWPKTRKKFLHDWLYYYEVMSVTELVPANYSLAAKSIGQLNYSVLELILAGLRIIARMIGKPLRGIIFGRRATICTEYAANIILLANGLPQINDDGMTLHEFLTLAKGFENGLLDR